MDTIVMIAFYALLFGVMYFLMIRPQKKQAKKTQDMLSQMKHGDQVVTIGGLHGTIEEVNTAENTVTLDCEGIFLTFEKRAIARIKKSAPTAAEPTVVLDENTEDISE
ncbi:MULTISPECIES: preprotein translocase subunit YajC [unclassified Jeotgalibaca]|uniref:preprotein translocase subunit YajC n=1 Tax=unclassified Jeotgalibaca TaxID=2621505 RepID=UPI003FD66041